MRDGCESLSSSRRRVGKIIAGFFYGVSLISLCAASAFGQVERTCGRAKADSSINNIIDCGAKIVGIFNGEGIHPAAGSIVPGSGMGGGIGYTHSGKSGNDGRLQYELNSTGLFTYKKYWEFDTNLRLTILAKPVNTEEAEEPPPSSDSSSSTRRPQLSRPKINLYLLARGMPRLDFFGIGPESKEEDRVNYNYREIVAGADFSKALSRRLNIGGAVEGIWPRLTPITNLDVRSINRFYTEQSAPGLDARANFLHYALFVGLHSAQQFEVRKLDYKFFYHFYQDWSRGAYSFRRLDVRLANVIPLGGIVRSSDPENPAQVAEYKRSEIRLNGRLSLSYTNRGQRVPFYWQETLGGSNINGEDTLRGFSDYRFRDRGLMLLQTEYRYRLNVPLSLVAFYDMGKVMPGLKDIGLGRWRHTYGVGLAASMPGQNKTLFRFYISFGSGEGTRTLLGNGDAWSNSADRLIR